MIIPASDRTVEAEMALAIEACCRTRAYGEASAEKLRFILQEFIALTPADKMVSEKRLAELKWHTVMSNVHRTISKNRDAYGGRLRALPKKTFGVSEIVDARLAKQAAIWGTTQ